MSKHSLDGKVVLVAGGAKNLGGLTQIEDIVPLIKFLVTDGWWITGQTIFANGGYTTR